VHWQQVYSLPQLLLGVWRPTRAHPLSQLLSLKYRPRTKDQSVVAATSKFPAYGEGPGSRAHASIQAISGLMQCSKTISDRVPPLRTSLRLR